jgi:hypothetical protein
MTSSEHLLIVGDSHLRRVHQREYCMCFESCCVSGDMGCICKDCDCGLKGSPIISTRLEAVVPDKPEHACVDCGTEVFRNGTRGRFPSRCPECKEKR